MFDRRERFEGWKEPSTERVYWRAPSKRPKNTEGLKPSALLVATLQIVHDDNPPYVSRITGFSGSSQRVCADVWLMSQQRIDETSLQGSHRHTHENISLFSARGLKPRALKSEIKPRTMPSPQELETLLMCAKFLRGLPHHHIRLFCPPSSMVSPQPTHTHTHTIFSALKL